MKALLRSVGYVCLILSVSACQMTPCKLEPTIIYTPSPSKVADLPSAFPPLTNQESQEEWSKELLIGDAFAAEWDLYRAITGYKRALVLIPEESVERRLQLDYDITLCYYLGLKYEDAISVFENSRLKYINHLFPAYNQVLLMMYDCYFKTGQEDKAERLLNTIQKASPETGEDLQIYQDLLEGNLCEAQAEIEQHRDFCTIQPTLDLYYQYAKSPSYARKLNAILPGAGYYYIGQRKTAMTAFLINALFIAASYQFFRNGYPAAGAITASLEAGWYLGGINGVGIEAQEFNNRLYDGMSKKILQDHCFFPVLMFESSF